MKTADKSMELVDQSESFQLKFKNAIKSYKNREIQTFGKV